MGNCQLVSPVMKASASPHSLRTSHIGCQAYVKLRVNLLDIGTLFLFALGLCWKRSDMVYCSIGAVPLVSHAAANFLCASLRHNRQDETEELLMGLSCKREMNREGQG
jgi:hypothetical protein